MIPPKGAKYRARLRVVDEAGRLIHHGTCIYYFDADMQELGYHIVYDTRFHSHTAGRPWSAEFLDKYEITEVL
ncbi:MAG: hypothetical protein C0610_16670 [Desulfobacteraceae bacterium]|nr:MAG: hypothetical protein C0610_16670 [Desulfobacteraceae bacterium]